MRVDDLGVKFNTFHTAFCREEHRPYVPDSVFTFDKDRLEESDLVAEWNRRAEHWRLRPLGVVLNLSAVLNYFNFNFSEREYVLGVGSGIGIYESFLGSLFASGRTKNVRFLGVDNAKQMVRRHTELVRKANLTNVWPIIAPATRLPLDDGTIDHVMCLDAIQWIPDWRGAIREIARVMKPKGHRRAFFNVHEKLRGSILRGGPVAVNDAFGFRVVGELKAQGFRVEHVVPVDGGTGMGTGTVGTLIVARYQSESK